MKILRPARLSSELGCQISEGAIPVGGAGGMGVGEKQNYIVHADCKDSLGATLIITALDVLHGHLPSV